MVETSPQPRLKYRYLCELHARAFSLIDETDPYRMSKTLHLKNWCRSFFHLFIRDDEGEYIFLHERLEFFIDILSSEECWEINDTIHCVQFNRRKIAKKVVQTHSPSGIPTPLDYSERYRIACCCCLEEDVLALFEYFKENSAVKADNAAEMNMLVARELYHGRRDEPLTCFWTRLAGGLSAEIQQKGKHIYEIGLESVYVPYVPYVEAVEYFWDKINLLPPSELSDEQKYNIFIKAAVFSSGNRSGQYPEVLEFCLRHISPNMYSCFLDNEYDANKFFPTKFFSLVILRENFCFDILQKVFHCLNPRFFLYISRDTYYDTLKYLVVSDYSENYFNEAVQLFLCMWRKEECLYHVKYVLNNEINGNGTLLVSLVQKNYMNLVWEVLDKEKPDNLHMFLGTEKSKYIASLLQERGDEYSLNKFLSYEYAIRTPEFEQNVLSTSSMEMDTDVMEVTQAKKRRLE